LEPDALPCFGSGTFGRWGFRLIGFFEGRGNTLTSVPPLVLFARFWCPGRLVLDSSRTFPFSLFARWSNSLGFGFLFFSVLSGMPSLSCLLRSFWVAFSSLLPLVKQKEARSCFSSFFFLPHVLNRFSPPSNIQQPLRNRPHLAPPPFGTS